ncbi:hypothetical protein [Mucilaginibacter ginkgonis]|uniref:Uncharacterized protein n=1 Tax=Mucilaginibacter ginkgonis TaxID=2682091 RepID=A0A6I4HW76_9SPHI|nr:hypothetical protein [Mucilaginibacter ginkgonis]QQL51092.1 hypothetical protein GO620_006480 [Mucilaginibacter ginkgonis]
MDKNTLSQEVVKYIDYGSEEYVKQLMELDSRRKQTTMLPYVGVLRYPSSDFKVGLNYAPTVQFQDSTYVGYMDMLLPTYTPTDNTSKTSFSVLEFELDGVTRQFLQVSKGDAVSTTGQKFKDFVAGLYPKANHQIPFNRSFLHTLKNVNVKGGEYVDSANGWVLNTQGAGQYTSSLEFEIAISGYKIILQ